MMLKKTAGVNNPNSKLTKEQVLEIRQLRRDGMQFKDIAAKYGVTADCARKVARRIRYASIQ